MSQSEKRMLWLRNLTASAGDFSTKLEAELASEVLVPGILSYAKGRILCGPTTLAPDANGLFKYTLRLEVPRERGPLVTTSESVATRRGYVFREGPLGELVALFSLCLQARLYLLSATFGELTDHGLPLKTEYSTPRGRFGPQVDGVLFSPTDRNLTYLVAFLQEVEATPHAFHQAIATAAAHYARAVQNIGIDDEMVFVRLVSAIEAVAVDQPILNDPLSGATVEDCLRLDVLTADQANEVRQLFVTRRAKVRFIVFLQTYSRAFFDGESREPEHIQVTPDNLAQVAAAIYDARSGYLHNGDPMYLSRRIRDFPEWHSDPSVGMTLQDREFTAKQKLPHAEFFHRLTRHCLLAYMRELIRQTGAKL